MKELLESSYLSAMSKEDVLLFGAYGMRGSGKSYYEKLKDKEIERLKESEEYYRKGFAELHKRIEEAIEYIKDNIIDFDFVNSNYPNRKYNLDIDLDEKIIKDLVDILKGSDKDED